jgi:hypothetical protein
MPNRGGDVPPRVNAAFAEALAGSDDSSKHYQHRQHKARQLCRQVQCTLSLTLAGDCADTVLSELYVIDVVPAAGSSRLLVYVQVPTHIPVADALDKLDRATPRLRAAVTRAITRRRAPEQ